jgi:hypothetical protein
MDFSVAAYFPIFPKQPRFVLYILQPAGILIPSF